MKSSTHLLHRINQSPDGLVVRYADPRGRVPLRDSERLRPPTGNPSVVIAVVLTVIGLAVVSLYLNR